MLNQEFDSGEINHLFSGFIGLLVISNEPSECVQPCKCSFDHPSERLRGKSFCSVRCVADFNLYVEILLNLIGHLTSVTSVHEYLPEGRPEEGGVLTKWIGQSGVMFRRVVNPSSQYKAIAIHNHTALDAFDFLVGIKPVITHPVAPLDTLSIKCSHTGCVIPATLLSDLHNRLFYKMLYASVLPPFTQDFIDGLPFREILREHTPLTSTDQKDVSDRSLFYAYENFFLLSTLWLRVFHAPNV